jgi:hypothetical protein
MNRFIESVIKSAAKREGVNVKVKVNKRDSDNL